MATLTDPVAYLAEHYVYEVSMLRWTHSTLAGIPDGFLANALIEAFCVHARALMDFYKSTPQSDDVVATHFIQSGRFSASATLQIPADIRGRVNKQIAHLTAARENPSKKIDDADRQTLLTAIENDHAAFKQAVDSQYANCFSGEQTVAATAPVVSPSPASATNHIQVLGRLSVP